MRFKEASRSLVAVCRLTGTLTRPSCRFFRSYSGSTALGTMPNMGVQKISVSFDLELGEAIRDSAHVAQTSVSAWLAEAARDRLRLEALGQAVATWEQELGPLTEAEIARADRLLQHETKRRSGAA